jgi:histone-lysine N-methyltransferase SETMAR
VGFQYLEHPPYSPNLAPSDYHLFPGIKKQFKGRHFLSDAEVIVALKTLLDGQLSDFFFLSGLQNFEQRAKKCIELREEYVEQIPSLVAVACFLPGRAKDFSAPLRIEEDVRVPVEIIQPNHTLLILNKRDNIQGWPKVCIQ